MAAAAWLASDWSSAYLSSTLYFLPFMSDAAGGVGVLDRLVIGPLLLGATHGAAAGGGVDGADGDGAAVEALGGLLVGGAGLAAAGGAAGREDQAGGHDDGECKYKNGYESSDHDSP